MYILIYTISIEYFLCLQSSGKNIYSKEIYNTITITSYHLRFVHCFWIIVDAGSVVEEAEFSWDDYLEDTGATAAPHSSFRHVSKHLVNVVFCMCSLNSDPLVAIMGRSSSFQILENSKCSPLSSLL